MGGQENLARAQANNQVVTRTLMATVDPIVSLRFTGGGNEGVINEICSN